MVELCPRPHEIPQVYARREAAAPSLPLQLLVLPGIKPDVHVHPPAVACHLHARRYRSFVHASTRLSLCICSGIGLLSSLVQSCHQLTSPLHRNANHPTEPGGQTRDEWGTNTGFFVHTRDPPTGGRLERRVHPNRGAAHEPGRRLSHTTRRAPPPPGPTPLLAMATPSGAIKRRRPTGSG